MKKLIVLLAAGALAVSATADLTGFVWKGGKAFDQSGVVLPAGAELSTTTIDLSAFVVDGQIQIANIPVSFYAVRGIGVAPPFLGGAYSTDTINGVNVIEGQVLPTVYAVLKNGTGPIAIGDVIGLTAGFATIDLDPGGGTPGLPQEFAAGDITTSILVVGEIGPLISLTVASDHGYPSPATGVYNVPLGMTPFFIVATPVLEGGTNYTCTGWTGTGDVPATGSSNETGSITLNQDSSITWNWVTNYWLDVAVNGNGSVSVSNGWHSAGTNLTVFATPDSGWLFMGWSGDLVGDFTIASTNLLMNGPKTIIATFSDDADGDELTNTEEGILGTDPRDSDSDDDLITDSAEVSNGLNPLVSNVDVDSDSDGLLDSAEVNTHGTDPLDADSDNDNLLDGDEVNIHGTDPLDDDTDNDLIFDGAEIDNGLNPLVSNTSVDSDSDGLFDVMEVNTYGTNPLSSDTDGDFLLDLAELFTWGTNPTMADTDSDGLTDHTEIFITVTSPTDSDSDDDGLNDGDEINTYGTNPKDADSDDDGLLDGDEINTYYTDPLDADTDADGLTDGDEINVYFTIPTDSDTDNDGASDGDEVNIHGTDPNDANSDADQDEDGIYDVWEREHFGVIQNCDPGDDPDGDLYTNLEEFLNDTDPNVFDTYLMHWTAVELGYKAATGMVYQIQMTTNLTSGIWSDVGDPIEGDGQTHYLMESTRPGDNKAYRVLIQDAPPSL